MYQQSLDFSIGSYRKVGIFKNMQVWNGIHNRPALERASVVTLGNFDGLHYGHQELLKRVTEKAQVLDAQKIVMTFDPHPVQVLYPEKGLKRLFPRDDLIEQLSRYGFDELILEPFSREFSQLKPAVFFQDYLFKPLNLKALVVGHDFSFGVDRSGNLEQLEKLCAQHKVQLDVVQPFAKEGAVISSSRIRKVLSVGDVEQAQALLGRPFYLQGLVAKGDQRGHTLGFPTANITPENEVVPQNGVYLSRVTVQNKAHMALTNIGTNPTFDSSIHRPRVESFLLDFEGDLYGLKIKVELLKFWRAEKKFSGAKELVEQIRRDVEWAQTQLKGFK